MPTAKKPLTAKSSSLVFVESDVPGISRKKTGRGFSYYAPDGTRIVERDEVKRLNSVGLPPAYENCWFCPLPNGHLQATGYDARKRKQYRYHVEFREQREQRKFELCGAFGETLPALRKQVEIDMARSSLDKRRTLAAMIRLLDNGLLRVGNDRYVKRNETFGATTLRERHVKTQADHLQLQYKAKSGKQREIALNDHSLARFVRKLQDLPGQRLFQYLGTDGTVYPLSSDDVNSYIKEYCGDQFSAKHFRTFGASRLAYEVLAEAKETVSIKEMTETVASKLGNTATVTRKSYIHPALVDLCNQPVTKLEDTISLPRKTKWLSREERGLISLLAKYDSNPAR